MARKTRSRKVYRRRQRGGEEGGEVETPAMTGGRRRYKSSKKGGSGVLATAAVPFGLLALQRYFKGSSSTKKNVRGLGNTFKRTFRRRR